MRKIGIDSDRKNVIPVTIKDNSDNVIAGSQHVKMQRQTYFSELLNSKEENTLIKTTLLKCPNDFMKWSRRWKRVRKNILIY